MSHWQTLSEEIQQWQQPIPFWWRDDDAIEDSDALQQMLAMAKRFQIPVHLAVIPQRLKHSLNCIKELQHKSDCYVLQHGFDHTSYASPEQRKIELGGTQSITQLTDKLLQGRQILADNFESQYLDILVPPWNRISEELSEKLPAIGYKQLSVLASPKLKETDFLVNVHIDIINWKERAFAGEEIVIEKIRQYLAHSRTQNLKNFKPCGIMTHHLDHDPQCWQFLDKFFTFCQQHSQLQWLSGEDLFPNSTA